MEANLPSASPITQALNQMWLFLNQVIVTNEVKNFNPCHAE